jgi:AcrR family transcriptional regulator
VGTRERRTRERQETREMILAAARDMFAEEGYDAVTMRAIAERVEYSPTALYHHFKNKQALLTELCERDFAALGRVFMGQVAATADPVERILAAGRTYVRFAIGHPSHYRFMFMTFFPRIEGMAGIQDDPERDAYAFLREACRQAIEQGRLRPELEDPDELAQVLWGAVHGLISLRLTKQHLDAEFWGDLTERTEAAMQMMLRGIVREPSKRRAAS